MRAVHKQCKTVLYSRRRSCIRAMASMSLQGRSYLVTGSTDGIGQHTAQKLAAQGATVLLHGRSQEKVDAAARRIKDATGSSNLRKYVADLGSLEQVRKLAADIKTDNPDGLDVFISNAGVYATSPSKSADGYELTWAVNVLAPFLLTSLLLPVVHERIVVVASISAASRIDWANLQQERGFSSDNAYSLSKLCNIVHAFGLAQRLKASGSKVTVNCLDPGTVNTKMLLAGWGPIGMQVKDANYEFQLATDPALGNTTGTYFVSGRKTSAPREASSPEVQKRLWELWEQQTGAKYPC